MFQPCPRNTRGIEQQFPEIRQAADAFHARVGDAFAELEIEFAEIVKWFEVNKPGASDFRTFEVE